VTTPAAPPEVIAVQLAAVVCLLVAVA